MDDLDRILAQAQWPDPSEQSLERLQDSWRTLSAQAQRRRMRIGWMSLAASVLLAICIAGLLTHSRPKTKQIAIQSSPSPVVTTSARPKVIVREPTLRERLTIIAASPPTVSPLARIDRAIREKSVKELQAINQPAVVEQRLIEQAQSRDADKSFAAVELLSEVGSPACLPLLLQQENEKMQAAMPGICRLASSEKLGQLIREQANEQFRPQMLTAIISRRDHDSLQLYLSFVRDAAYREDALASLRAMPNPPVDALLAEFDHSQVAYRFAAATAVGRICHGNVTPLLLRMVDQDDHRREALAALSFCHDPAAQKFIAAANASIRSEIRAVQNEMANQL